jgi:signal transduction histidine kinase
MQLGAVDKKFMTSGPGALEELRRIQRRLKQYIAEARESILLLRSPEPQRTLTESLRDFVDDLAKEGRDGIRLNVTGDPGHPCSDTERELLRIAQEALRNAFEHGEASVVRVELEYSRASIRLRVMDDGRGFTVDERRADQRHWGLVGMEERARGLGGTLTINSRVGHGTDVDVTVPRASAA